MPGPPEVHLRPPHLPVERQRALGHHVVGDRFNGTAVAEWAYRVAAATGGTCTITQSVRHLPDGLSGTRSQADAHPEAAEEILHRRAAALRDGMRQT
jgi:hypothetical protein